jgi:hypothetical protein
MKAYEVKYIEPYEPYVVVWKASIPRFNERFRYMHKLKYAIKQKFNSHPSSTMHCLQGWMLTLMMADFRQT